MTTPTEFLEKTIPRNLRDYRGELSEAGVTREQRRARLSAYVLNVTPNNRKTVLRAAARYTEWFEGEQSVAEFAKNADVSADSLYVTVQRMSAIALDDAYDMLEQPDEDLIEQALADPEFIAPKPKQQPVVTETNLSATSDVALEKWNDEAACAGQDIELFFPKVGQGASEALKFCVRCDVREECLQYALQNNEQHGIWGGKTAWQRKQMR